MSPPAAAPMPAGVGSLLGHEAADRFSFSGVKGILTILLVAHLTSAAGAPQHLTAGEAKTAYHFFLAGAYFFPLLGSLLADILWGKFRTILYLSLGYCVGLACLAWSGSGLGLALVEPRWWLVVGLIFVAVGAGAVKPSVSTFIGDQFGEEKQPLLAKVRHGSFFALNVAAAASYLLTPWLLERYGPWLAFGVPGLLTGIAVFVFWKGRGKFVRVPPTGFQSFRTETLGPEGLTALKKVIPLFLMFLPVYWCVFDQTGSAWVLQATRMDRKFLGVEWFESQVQAVNPVLLLVLVPLFAYVVYPVAGRLVKVTPLRKIGVGLFLAVAAFGVAGWIETQSQGGSILECSSQADRSEWQADHLIDGDAENTTWVSDVDPQVRGGENESAPLFPQAIIFQLRESRPWTIEGLRIHPANNLGRFLMQKREVVSAATARRLAEADVDTCNPKTIRVSVADTPNPTRGWRRVGTISLARSIEVHQAEIRPIEAKYVQLEIVENWGGPFVGLAEVEILARGELPADSSSELADFWPNVAVAGTRPNIAWQVFAYVLLTVAEVLVSIVALELAYSQTPPTMKSLVLAIFFLGASLGNLFTAVVNSFIQNEDGTSKLPGASYYWFFALLMLVTATLYLVWIRYFPGENGAERANTVETKPNAAPQ